MEAELGNASDSATAVTCRHCGTPYSPGRQLPEGYCCHGCAYVHRLIEEEGLERYYELRGEAIQPVGTIPLQPQSFEWLREQQKAVEQSAAPESRSVRARFHLQGISCVGCVWLIEKLFLRHEGAVRAVADPQRGELRLQWIPGSVDLPRFALELQRYGYLLSPEPLNGRDLSRELGGRLALCGAFAMNAMLFTLPRYLGMEEDFALARLFELLTLLFATLSFVVGGSYFITRALRALQHRVLHIDLPIALGLTLAYVGSLTGWILQDERFLYFDFVSIFSFLMLVGRWLQERAVTRNRNQLSARQAEPEAATRLTPTGPERVPLKQLQVGDEVEIGPGEMLPVSGELVGTGADFSLEWINGESEPRHFPSGRLVPAGASSIESRPIQIRVTEIWADSLLARLLAPASGTPESAAYARFLKVYLAVVLFLASAGCAVWALLLGEPLTAWQVALSILVVSCPCAIGVALPLADELAIARLRSGGLFVRELSLFSRLRHIREILFDKTGTLTFEYPTLQNPDALQALSPHEQEVLLQMVESSHHPLSRSLREALLAQLRNPTDARSPQLEIHELSGAGLRASDREGSLWTLGRADWDGEGETGAERGVDVVFRCDGVDRAAFHFADQLRESASETIGRLRTHFSVWILSGDREEKVSRLARQLGLPPESALAALSPDDKARWVQQRPAQSTLFLGDGANDSLAFDRAAVRGTPVINRGVLEHKADFFLLSRGLGGLLRLFIIATQRNRAVRAVMTFALLYNAIAVSLCLAALMNPLLAAILMPLSSLATLGIVKLSFTRSTGR